MIEDRQTVEPPAAGRPVDALVGRKWAKAKKIVDGMTPWFAKINHRKKLGHDGRTIPEAVFDSGVLAAAEMVRRLTGDEELAMAIHEVCIWRQNQHRGVSD